jgi:hypothetical protein
VTTGKLSDRYKVLAERAAGCAALLARLEVHPDLAPDDYHDTQDELREYAADTVVSLTDLRELLGRYVELVEARRANQGQEDRL